MPIMGKQILVIGSGGREHAICWKLSQSSHIIKIFAFPGSYGISQVPKCVNLVLPDKEAKDYDCIVKWCLKNKIDMVVVGPEDPLANGLSDKLTKSGVRCFGPGKQGAQIEADKKWAKDFMLRHQIPTARYQTFTDCAKAKEFIQNAPFKALVVKASGLAAGKGVVVAANIAEACKAVDEILGDKKYGSAGETLVVEELLTGEEVSVLAFVDNQTVQVMLPAQDHKRLKDKDEGPNTGGMGAYCPCPIISNKDLDLVKTQVLEKAVAGLRAEGINYCGVLYAGMMLTPDGPKTLEFNCRFGDPETQVILPMLESDLYEVMSACCDNKLRDISLRWRNGVSAVGVVMASAGYPETSTKGCFIEGIPLNTSDQIVFHSGITVDSNGKLLTNGGRVLIAVTLRLDLRQAAKDATKICQGIKFSGAGAQFRTDIAEKAFKFQKIQHTSLSYKDSGVDIDAGDDLVQRIKPLSIGTQRPGCVGSLGGFGGLFRLKELNYKNPVICEATNGVGAKIQLALDQNMPESIGYDLFAMCANDILEFGAEPIGFLDYIACGKLNVPLAAQIVKGISEGCRVANCALLGGETAEMPSVYKTGKYDIAGYCVGIVEKGQELPKYDLYEEGDLLIALPSQGLHCTSFNAILTCIKNLGIDLCKKMEFGDAHKTLGQQLAEPSAIYVKEVLHYMRSNVVKAVVHITSGLIPDVARLLPAKYETRLDFGDLKVPEIYGWLAAEFKLNPNTILQNLNCGIGMILVVPKANTTWRTIVKGAKVIGVLKKKTFSNTPTSPVEVRNFEEALLKFEDKFGPFGSGNLLEAHYNDMQSVLTMKAEPRPESYCAQNGKRLTVVPKTFKDPILIMGTDGVGTKIKIAQQTGRNCTVGIDLVAMCVNDILCNGAEPYTFSSYYACGEVRDEMTEEIMDGVIEGSRQADSTLIDTHISEVPLLYQPDVYDLAGFSLGIAENQYILPKSESIRPGDILVGLPSSGVHSNGFSLVHAVMKLAGVSFTDRTPFSNYTFGEEFLRPTKIYVKALAPLIKEGLVKAIAHITGGGLTENIPRVLRKDLAVQLNAENFNIPPVFAWLAREGNIKCTEMQRTYNCGLGMVLVIDPKHQHRVMELLQYTERATKVGFVKQRDGQLAPQVIVDNFEKCLKYVQKIINTPRKRLAVLISGSGTNLQALINATRDTSQCLHSDIVLVISNKADVMGVYRAKKAGIPTVIVSHKNYQSREDFDAALTEHLVSARVDIVCLAGFMRVLSESFVKKWKGKLINIHPSLLPKHPGLHVQEKALEAGDKESGCTVHFVDEGVDTGAIIVQSSVPILPGDTVDALTQRIHIAEYYAFPRAIHLLATEKLHFGKDGQCVTQN